MSRQHNFRQPLGMLLAALLGVLATATSVSAHDFGLVPNAFQLSVRDTLSVIGGTSSSFLTTESAGATEGGRATQSRDSLDVVSAVKAYDRALSTGDSTAALALLADDAVIVESGTVEARDEYRRHHLPADMEFAKSVPSQNSSVSVKVRGDVAWAWSTATTQGIFRGRPIDGIGAELMVLTRMPTGWKISAIHWSSRSRRP